MARQRLVDRVLAETILFGGQPCRRIDVVRKLRAEGFPERGIDLFAFRPEALDATPLPYEEIQ